MMKKGYFHGIRAAAVCAALLLCGAVLSGCDPKDPASTPSTQGTTTTAPAETTATTPATTASPETTAPSTAPETTAPTEPTTTAPSTTAPSASGEGTGAAVANLAATLIDAEYRYGAAGPDAFDNSGLLFYCYTESGITVPRRTGALYQAGQAVDRTALQTGDAVFFYSENPGNPEYAGIYVGEGRFIAANSEDNPVKEYSLDMKYFSDRYLGARRYSAGA